MGLKPDPASEAILKSTLFKIEVSVSGGRLTAVDMIGGGNGHGVGMCQTGAIRMAELGYSGEEIIRALLSGLADRTRLQVGDGPGISCRGSPRT